MRALRGWLSVRWASVGLALVSVAGCTASTSESAVSTGSSATRDMTTSVAPDPTFPHFTHSPEEPFQDVRMEGTLSVESNCAYVTTEDGLHMVLDVGFPGIFLQAGKVMKRGSIHTFGTGDQVYVGGLLLEPGEEKDHLAGEITAGYGCDADEIFLVVEIGKP